MFFVVSKLLAFFEEPSNVIILAGIVGLILTRTRYARWGWRLAAAALVLIALIGFLPIGRSLTIALENRFPRWEEAGAPPAGIIVLGGAVSAYRLATRGQVGLTDAAERIVVVPELARKFPDAKIIYSGGDPGLFTQRGSEADVVRRAVRKSRRAAGADHAREPLAQHRGERRLFEGARRAEAGRALAARHLRHAHAARDRRLPRGRISGRGLSGRLQDQRLAGPRRPVREPLGGIAPDRHRAPRMDRALAYRLTGKSSALFPGDPLPAPSPAPPR